MNEKDQQNELPVACNKGNRRDIVTNIKRVFTLQEQLQEPTLPADFENLRAFRRACESINYNLCAMEYRHFPHGQLRKAIVWCLAVFFIIVAAWLTSFTAIKGIQHILEPLPGLLANGILALVVGMAFIMFFLNFFKIMKFIITTISSLVLKKTK